MLNHELLSELTRLHVDTVAEFDEEYFGLIRQKPNRYSINKKVFELIHFICMSHNPSIFCRHKNIEKPTGSNGLYAIKIKNGCNIRILFSLEKNGTVLLHSFEEIGGKSATDYTSAIPTAEKRLAERKGGKK